jgi:hypothetical protein
MRFHLSNISPKLQQRLIRQNSERVKVFSHEIRAGVIGKERTIQFRILAGEKPSYDLPGTPYRVLAGFPDPEAALFPVPIGHFDYRIVKGGWGDDSAISAMCHDSSFLGDKTALTVAEDTRKNIRGIGRAMTSIVLNHIASERIAALTLHDVLNPRFFYRYSKTARIVDRYRIDKGGDETITMELDAEPEKEIASIILSSRAEPIQQVLENLSTQSRKT